MNVHSLRSHPGARHDVHLAGSIPGMSVSESGVAEEAEVTFDGWVESARGGVTVAGTVHAPWSGTCRRCLEPATGVLVAQVRESCRDQRPTGGHRPAEPAEEDDSYLVGPEELDVEPIVRDACILELPLAPLCSDGCLGLCPDCGVNRNRQACSCSNDEHDQLHDDSQPPPKAE